MTDKPETEYYVGRLRAEREAAATASSEEAREAHRALALRYAQLLAARGHPAALEGVDPIRPVANPRPNPEA